MGHRHTRDEILAGALATAFDAGLSRLTFGRVAKRLGSNDRTVVYYFPTKDVLITEVILSLGGRLQEALTAAFSATATDHLELTAAAWPILASPDVDPVFALFFEANGLAAAGREPDATLVPQLVEAWIAWVGEFVEGTSEQQRTEATATIALVDGLLLVRHLAGADAAEIAAARLGGA